LDPVPNVRANSGKKCSLGLYFEQTTTAQLKKPEFRPECLSFLE
jgi:hypothetical protein